MVGSQCTNLVGEEGVGFCDRLIIGRVHEQVKWIVKLIQLSLLKNHDLIAVRNSSVKSMSHHEHSLLVRLCCVKNTLKHTCLRLAIDVRGWFIQKKNVAIILVQNCLSKSQELNLTSREHRGTIVQLDGIQTGSNKCFLQGNVRRNFAILIFLQVTLIDAEEIIPNGVIFIEVWVLQDHVHAIS